MPVRFAPGAVLLQLSPTTSGKIEPCTLVVGAPAPGANKCPPDSHRGGAPTIGPNHPGKIEPCTFAVGAPAPGANKCPPRVRTNAGPLRTGGGAPTTGPTHPGKIGPAPQS